MSAWGLAWRTLTRSPARSVLAIVGVTVIGALLFTMLLLSHGLLISFRDLLDSAGFDIRVVAAQGSMLHRPPIAGAVALADEIRRLPTVERVVIVRTDSAGAALPGDERRGVGVTLIGTTEHGARMWDLVKGSTLPGVPTTTGPMPVVVSTKLAARLRLEPGAPLRIRAFVAGGASAIPSIECRVVGIGAFSFEAADDFTVATTMDGFAAIHGAPPNGDAELVLVASRAGSDAAPTIAAVARLRPDLRAYSNDQVLEQFNRNAFSYFRQISTVLATLTLAFAFLLVATLLTMSVNQRLGEVAALRALGFPRRRIAANLLCESALLVGVGGLAALPVGGALAVLLDRILRHMPGIPARLHFFVFEPRAVVMHAMLLAVTALLAAAYPIWLASRLPIAATLRREVVS